MIYIAPPLVLLDLQSSNIQSNTLTSFPVINKAPPSTTVKLFVKLDFSIVTFEPVRQIVPPLELERVPSVGSMSLIPLLFRQVILYKIPLSPCQNTAPPSSPAMLSVNVELDKIQLSPATYNAAPSKLAPFFVNEALLMVA